MGTHPIFESDFDCLTEMPRIDSDVKLDFKDVLFRPKRSGLKSRSQVELKREYKFRNSGRTYQGVPVMAANMDTTGTFNIAKCFNEHGMFTCIHKHYSLDEWKAFAKECPDVLANIAVSSGTSD